MIRELKNVFSSRNATLILLASVSSNFGDWFYFTAMTAHLAKNNGLATLAFISSFRFACWIFLMPLGGAFVEKLPKKIVMIAADAFRFVGMSLMAYGIYAKPESIAIVAVLSSCCAVAGVLFSPARRALLPLTVDQEHRTALNSLDGTLETLVLTLAPAIGGALLIYLDVAAVVLLNGFSFLISAIFLVFIKSRSSLTQVGNEAHKARKFGIGTLITDTREGLIYVFQSGRISTLAVVGFACSVGVGATWIFTPLIVYKLGMSDSAIGYISSAIGLGSILGLLAGGSAKTENKFRIVLGGIFAFSLAMGLWAFSTEIVLAAFAVAALMGFFANVFIPPFWSILQNNTKEELFARVFSAVDAFGLMGMFVGTSLAAYLVKVISLSQSILVLSLLMVSVCIIGSFLYRTRVQKNA